MKLKTIKYFFILAVLVAAGVFGFFAYKKMFNVRLEKTHQAITDQVLHVAELTTLKNNYSDIVSIKKSGVGGLSKAYAIIKFSAVIRIGVDDLSKTQIAVDSDGSEVSIKIPHCRILDNTLVEQKVFDEKRSIFVPITTQEIFDEINLAMADFSLDAERRGLLKEADAHLSELVVATVKGFGFEKVNVEMVDGE